MDNPHWCDPGTMAMTNHIWSRIPRLIALFMIVTAIGAGLSAALACAVPGDFSLGLLTTTASIAALTAGIGGCFAFWPQVRQLLVIYVTFAGVGVSLAYMLVPDALGFDLTAGCVNGIACCISWWVLCRNQRWQKDARWLLAGPAAGVICHPLLWLYSLLTRQISFAEFAIWSCLGLLFYGLHTMSAGLVATTLCRLILPRISGRHDWKADRCATASERNERAEKPNPLHWLFTRAPAQAPVDNAQSAG
jgi:hypothetical protein